MPQVFGKPHSQAEWLKLPSAKRGFKTYDRYKQWWQSSVAPKFTVSDNPFDPIPFGAQKAMVNQQVSGAINPIIKAFEDSITRRSNEGSRSINQATNTFVKGVDPLAGNLGAVYDTSIAGQKGVNDTLSQFVRDTGGYTASELGKLIPDQDEGPTVNAAAQFGQGLSGQQMAQGASTLGRLYADRAADVGYGTKMPGYAQAFGTQGLQDFQRQLNLERDEGLGDIRSQIPGLVSGAMENMRSGEFNKAVARKGFEMDEDKIEAAKNDPGSQSWRTGPASQRYVTDPSTGQQYPNPNFRPGGTSSGKVNQTGITQTRKSAQDLHDNMMLQFRGDPMKGLAGIPANDPRRQRLLAANREKVQLQVIANLRSYYPGQSEAWVRQQAGAILAATGWPAVASGVLSGTNAPSQGTPSGAAPTVQPPAGGPAAAPAQPDVIDRNPTVKANTKASTAAAAANEKRMTERETRGSRAATAFVRQARADALRVPINQRQPWQEVKKGVISVLQRAMPGHPYKRIIAIANQVMAEYPSRYGK